MIAGGRDSSGMMRVSGQARARRLRPRYGAFWEAGPRPPQGPLGSGAGGGAEGGGASLLAPNSPAGSWAL